MHDEFVSKISFFNGSQLRQSVANGPSQVLQVGAQSTHNSWLVIVSN